MRKIIKSLLNIVVSLCLLLSVPLSCFGAEASTDTFSSFKVLHLETVEDFLTFSENCRLDSYSQNLVVVLDNDIDLTGADFQGIPTFGGVFEGGHHSLLGLSIQGEGSNQGLFRYLQASATVRNLTVAGEISPTGSRNNIGGIAGNNAGTITNCHFTGSVTGADCVGGLVGTNALTGIVENSGADGIIIGNHFTGGISGENIGVIRSCTNTTQINTTANQNSVEISDITLETLTNSESANTVTDVGGIAGYSSGVIRNCENQGNVGYQHMGYNIGGIAGTQSGYLFGCTNYGQIYGRKEVGGIVGQMEPMANVEYSEDTLQILRDQLNTMSSLTNQASANAQFSASKARGNIATLQGQIQGARDALDVLLPDRENTQLPDADSALAARNSLSNNLNAMPGTLSSISSNTKNAAYVISRDMKAITNQVNAMSQTLNNAEANLGGSITDISDEDTPADLGGKVEACSNFGAILADLNAGGITGAIAFENDLDPEEDVDIIGESSLNFESEVRAVILNCENSGSVTVKKQHGGGIVGWMSLGLAKGCANTGGVEGSSADYVGGIAGNSLSYIRASSAKCVLTGSTYVGGIAGYGSTVSHCRSMVQITGTERMGYVLGFAETLPDANAEEPWIISNYYLNTGSDIGAVDGISYAACAEPLPQEDFFALEDLQDFFETITLRFVYEDNTVLEIPMTPGNRLEADTIPALPQKDGYTAAWEGLDEIDLEHVSFDATIYGVYTKKNTTLSSSEARSNGLPILLAEGTFTKDQFITLAEASVTPMLQQGERLLEGRSFAISDGYADSLHYLPAEEYDTDTLLIKVKDSAGSWHEAAFREDGSYLVFDVFEDANAFCLVQQAKKYNYPLIIGCAAGIAILLVIVIVRTLQRKRKNHSFA